MQKALPLFLFVFGIMLVGLVLIFGRGNNRSTASVTPTPAPTITRNKPFIALIPSLDGHRITLNVDQVYYADTAEYEIRYERTSEVTRERIGAGIVGDGIKISGTSFSSGEKLFGSASSGVEKYDKDVQGAGLLVRLRGGSGGTGKYESMWALYPGSKKISFADGSFIYEGNLSKSAFYIVMNNIGLPKPIDGEIIAGPYSILTKAETMINGKVTIKLPTPEVSLKAFGWDEISGNWKDYSDKMKLDGQNVIFNADKLTTFVIVK